MQAFLVAVLLTLAAGHPNAAAATGSPTRPAITPSAQNGGRVAGPALGAPAQGQPAGPIAGTVVDGQGNTIPNALVRLEAAGALVGEVQTATDGRFAFANAAEGDVRLLVTASGFAQATLTIAPGDSRSVRITLEPAPFFEEVQVTSSRSEVPRADATVTMTVLSSSDLLTSAALTLDDALKQVPGFTLFRRTSSRVSNPGAQGVSLRGLGGSGASRSLVLADGVPLNDAFGGWVYWDKVPHAAIDRVEVLRGGGGDLYGADAVGGVVQILTVRPGRATARVLVEGGTLDTARVSVFGGGQSHGWRVSGAGQWFTTGGYILVADDERGAVDTRAASNHRSAMTSVGYHGASRWRFDIRGQVFTEDRENGTPAQVNDTDSRQVSVEVVRLAARGIVSTRVFGARQGYDQTFSAVSTEPPRTTEDLNRIHRVPTSVAGASAQWDQLFAGHSLLVGAELKVINGRTFETRLTGGRVLGASEVGGRQRIGSAFVRTTFFLGDRSTLVGAARGDGWHSESHATPFSQTIGAFIPSLSFSSRVGNGLTVRGSAYRGFRAPTLNELYRGFRVGNNVTDPNEALRPERLTGLEGGLLIGRGRVSARVTGFWNLLDDIVTNVTISTSPSLNVRQRQNADKMRSAGIEFEAEVRPAASVSLAVTGAVTNSRFKGQTTLRNYRAPQVPKYSVGVIPRYLRGPWVASGQLRVIGPQFEDDLNTLKLRRATAVDLFGSRALSRPVNLFAAVENLFNSDYDVGRTPTRTIGLPRTIRGGLQLALP